MRRLTILATTLLTATMCPPASANHSADQVEIPVSFFNDQCRGTLFAVDDEGGCTAGMNGSIDALCDADGCDVAVDVTATGTIGTSTPQPNNTRVESVLFTTSQGDEPNFLESHTALLCSHSDQQPTVQCAGTVEQRLEFFQGLGNDGDACVGVGLEVRSQSRLAVPGVPLAITTHEARSRSLDPDDTRPAAPGWLICRGDGGLYVLPDDFRYN